MGTYHDFPFCVVCLAKPDKFVTVARIEDIAAETGDEQTQSGCNESLQPAVQLCIFVHSLRSTAPQKSGVNPK